MRIHRLLGAAAATVLLGTAVLAAPAAAAGNVLTYNSTGGTAVPVGAVLTAALAPGANATLYTTTTGTTGVKCTASTFTSTVVTNPAAPGTATESTTGHTLSTCTSNVVGTTGVQSITINNLPFATTSSSAGVVTITGTAAAPIQTTMVLRSLLGNLTCVYRSNGNSLTGTTSNVGNTIAFSNQPFTKYSGPVTCPANGYFSATYGPVRGNATGSPLVFVN